MNEKNGCHMKISFNVAVVNTFSRVIRCLRVVYSLRSLSTCAFVGSIRSFLFVAFECY